MSTIIPTVVRYGNVIPKMEQFVYINNKNNLPLPINGVITLTDNKTYIFVNDIDLLGDRIVCGTNNTILGFSSENCSITSTGLLTNHPNNYMIESVYTVPIRHITLKNVNKCIGININNTSTSTIALDWTGVNFSGCIENIYLGNIDNFIFSKGSVLGSGSIIVNGTLGTFSIDNSILIGSGLSYDIIKFTSSAIINRRIKIFSSSMICFGSTNGINLSTSVTIPNETFILDSVNFSGGGNYLSDVSVLSLKSLFISCIGIKNTSVNGQIYMIGNTLPTILNLSNTFYKINGLTLPSTDNQKYISANNRLTNNAFIERKYLIQCVLSYTCGNNKVSFFGFYDSKLGTIRPQSIVKSTSNGAGRAESVSFFCVVNHLNGDYLEIWCSGFSHTDSIIVDSMNFVVTEII